MTVCCTRSSSDGASGRVAEAGTDSAHQQTMRSRGPIGDILAIGSSDVPILHALRRVAVREIRSALEDAATLDEAAEVLGVGRTTLWRWRDKYPELTTNGKCGK